MAKKTADYYAKQYAKEAKLMAKASEVAKKVNKKYKDWKFPAPSGPTVRWTVADWSRYIERNGIKK